MLLLIGTYSDEAMFCLFYHSPFQGGTVMYYVMWVSGIAI